MRNLATLREQRATKVDALRALTDKAGTENRDLNEQEQSAFEAGRGDVEKLDRDIRNAQFLAEAERHEGGAEPLDGRAGPDLAKYSAARAIRGALTQRLDGLEAEVHAELSRGRESRGVMIPTSILMGEQRGQQVGNAASGGYTVATQLASVADRINRPALKVEGMGATVLRNLTGDLDLPNLASSGSAHWVSEDQDTTRSAVTFEKVGMRPRTVSGEYQMSRRLMTQSNESIENLLRRDIGFILAQGLDAAAIAGLGVVDPTGILNFEGVEEVSAAAGLGDTASDLMSALEIDDVTGTGAFLTHPSVAGVARKLKDGNGQYIPLTSIFHNQRLETTTQVPSNLGGGGTKTALIWGLWSELVVGYWSAVDILVNPYHADVASKGGALLHAFLDADVAVRHPQAFRYALI